MKLFRWLGIAYLGVMVVNFLGCAPHYHEREVINERVVEQVEVVE